MRHLFISSCLITLLFLFSGQESRAAELTPDKSVLLLWGNPYIGPWEQNFNQIVLRELAQSQNSPVIPEFLSLLNAQESDKALIAESMSLKYSRSEVDLVIAVQVEASAFVHDWHHLFAPNAEVLYVLPGDELGQAITENASGTVLGSAIQLAAFRQCSLTR